MQWIYRRARAHTHTRMHAQTLHIYNAHVQHTLNASMYAGNRSSAHANTHTRKLSPKNTHTRKLSLAPTHANTLSLTHAKSLSHSHSNSLTHTHKLSLTHSHANSLSLFRFLSLFLSLALCRSFSASTTSGMDRTLSTTTRHTQVHPCKAL